MKKIVSMVLLAILLLTGILSSYGQAADQAIPEEMPLSLQKSIEMALENNIDLKKAKLNVSQQELAYKKTDDAADKVSDNPYGSYQGLLTEKFAPKQAKMLTTIAERSYDMQQNLMEMKVKQNYYTILLKQKLLAAKKGTLAHAKSQYEIAQLKFNQGLTAQHDILAAEVQLKSKENEWSAAQRDLAKAQMDYKQLLNMDINQKIKLTDDFKLNNKEVSLKKSIKTGLENRLDLLQAQETEQLYALNVDLAGKYYTYNTWAYKESAYQYEQAKMDLEKQISLAKLDINKAYLDLMGAETALEPAQKNVEQAKESLRITNLQYENGLATSLDVLNAQNLLENMEISYVNAIFAYTMSTENFDFAVNHGNPY